MASIRKPAVVNMANMEAQKLQNCTQATTIVEDVLAEFAKDPTATSKLFLLNFWDLTANYTDRLQELQLPTLFKAQGYSFQVVGFGGKTGQDTGVMITKD